MYWKIQKSTKFPNEIYVDSQSFDTHCYLYLIKKNDLPLETS